MMLGLVGEAMVQSGHRVRPVLSSQFCLELFNLFLFTFDTIWTATKLPGSGRMQFSRALQW
jgi:hypothetical protein